MDRRRPGPPIVADPTVPAELNAMILKCLALDPAERYQAADELARELEI